MIDHLRDEQAIIAKYTERLNAILPPGYTFMEDESKVSFSEKLGLGVWTLRNGNDRKFIYASFEPYPMINCCGICVSTRAHVREDMRGRGLGTLLNSLRIDIARFQGYSVLLCTDVLDNAYQRKVLARNGWKDIDTFLNKRTTNYVAISTIHL